MIHSTKTYTKRFFVVEQALWLLKIRDTEVATFNGSDAETDELTDGMDQDPDEADEDVQNDVKLLRKLLNKTDKHSLSHKQMKHVRVLLITSRRHKMMEIVQEVILGDPVM